MNGIDIVLINVISYLGGILSGIYIHHKMNKTNNQPKQKEKETDLTDNFISPIVPATPIPSAPPPNNPNLNKRIIITSE